MRVRLTGCDAPDLVALGRSFWNAGCWMLQITPQMKFLVAVEPVDFRQGIDGLVRLCKESLPQNPFEGGVSVSPPGELLSRILNVAFCRICASIRATSVVPICPHCS